MSYNALALYLRPLEDQQPYILDQVAQWLVDKKDFPNFKLARQYLFYLEEKYPWRFKTILSNYYEATDIYKNFMVYKSVDDYQTSHTNAYGEEPHMWY